MKKMIILCPLVFVGIFSFFSTSIASPNTECDRVTKAAGKGTPKQRLDKLLKVIWDTGLEESPESATYLGEPGHDDKWTDESLAGIQRRQDLAVCEMKTLLKIPRRKLSVEDALNFDLEKRELEIAVANASFGSDFLPINQLQGLQIDVPDLLSSMPHRSLRDYQNIIDRLRRLPLLALQTEALLREGLRKNLTPVKMFMEKVPAQFDHVMPTKDDDGPLFAPFKSFAPDIPTADQERLRKEAAGIIRESVIPALQGLRDFITNEYIPHCREFTAWTQMPRGEEWYAFLVRRETTTNLTPKDLHELGLREVTRIQAEMDTLRTSTGFKGDKKAFHQFLLKDPQFYYSKAADLLAGYRDVAKRLDAGLPQLFSRLPQLTYGVREMPAYKSANAPAAYYQPGSLKGGRAGYFEANTFDLVARPKWGMEVLTSHEAVPGHHLQISLAQDLTDLPEFRKNLGPTAFVEGWALYAEGLAAEIGMYQDPYSQYGHLIYEMWRAVRLVVDTGMHSMGWTRDQALEYFMDQLPKSRSESEAEIDRYITWPGQALAYKVGELKFREFRDKARAELGDRFDVREFHNEVLRHGALPIEILEQAFQRWLQQQKLAQKHAK